MKTPPKDNFSLVMELHEETGWRIVDEGLETPLPVATVYVDGEDSTYEKGRAERLARMFVAAPELLAVCKWFSELHTAAIEDRTLYTRFDIPHSLILDARSLVAKAEGGAK